MLWLSVPVGISGRVHKLLIPALATVICATIFFRFCAVSGGIALFELADPAITLARYGTRTVAFQLGFTTPSHVILFILMCIIILSSAATEAVALEPMIRLKDATVNVAKWMRGIQVCVVSLDLLRFLYPVVGIGADGIYSVQYLNCVLDNATGLLSVIALVTVLHVCLSQSRAVRLAEEQANHQRELAESRSSLIRWGFHGACGRPRAVPAAAASPLPPRPPTTLPRSLARGSSCLQNCVCPSRPCSWASMRSSTCGSRSTPPQRWHRRRQQRAAVPSSAAAASNRACGRRSDS